MRTPFKNRRTKLATAMTSAALIGAGSVAAVTAYIDSDPVPAGHSRRRAAGRGLVDLRRCDLQEQPRGGGRDRGHVDRRLVAVRRRWRRPAGAGLRLRLRRAGPCDHEPARRRRRRVGQGDLLERQDVRRDSRRQRSVDRRRRHRRRCPGVGARAARARQLVTAGSRRRRRRDREPVRPRADGHDGHRQRPPPPDHIARTTSPSTTRSRPTRRSTTATRAARCST